MDKNQLLKMFEYIRSKKDELTSVRESVPEDIEKVGKYIREAQMNLLMAMDEIKQKMQ